MFGINNSRCNILSFQPWSGLKQELCVHLHVDCVLLLSNVYYFEETGLSYNRLKKQTMTFQIYCFEVIKWAYNYNIVHTKSTSWNCINKVLGCSEEHAGAIYVSVKSKGLLIFSEKIYLRNLLLYHLCSAVCYFSDVIIIVWQIPVFLMISV